MPNKTQLTTAAQRVGNVHFEGLLRKEGVIRRGVGENYDDVLGFNYIAHEQQGGCYEFYAANPPLIGMTEPVPCPCPLGLETFDEYRIDYKEAVRLFHSGNWGNMFTSITLSRPLVHPQTREPFWHIRSNLGIDVVIGANSGEIHANT